MPPFHPIDLSRLPRYVTSTRIRCAIAAAYSSKLNPRNLEVDYYPAYNHTLADLVDFEFDGALTVRQQYDLWLSKSTFDLYKIPPGALETLNYYWFDDPQDDSEVEDEENPTVEIPVPGEEVAEVGAGEVQFVDILPVVETPSLPASSSPPRHVSLSGRPIRNSKPPARDSQEFIISPQARAALHPIEELTQEALDYAIRGMYAREFIVDNLSDASEADISLETTATVPDTNGKDQFPDMLLCHSYAVEVDKPADQKAVLGWQRRARCKVSHHCFPLIMEIKACPSRSLRGQALGTKLNDLMVLAASQLYNYVQTYFVRDLCATSVIAMIAAGPYWRWIRVERGEVWAKVSTHPNATGLESPLETKARGAFLSRLKGASNYLLGTDESDKELTQLRNEFLIPLIESHRRYPSTMVPNPPLKKKDGTSE